MRRTLLCIAIGLISVIGCNSSEPASQDTPNIPTPPQETVKLPSSSDDAFCEEEIALSGGDLMASADRIVVGRVVSIDVVDKFWEIATPCPPEAIYWSLRVKLDVSDNLKGVGDTVEFLLSDQPQLALWDTAPLHKKDGKWLPTGMGEPKLNVTETLAWNGTTGITLDQELIVFLWEISGEHGPLSMPLGQRDVDGRFQFQADNLPGTCAKLPSSFQGATLSEIQSLMNKPALVDPSRWVFNSRIETFSSCAVIHANNETEVDAGNDQN